MLLILISCFASKPQLFEDIRLESKINCSLELQQDSFFIGEVVDMYFVVTNNTNQIIYIDSSPYGGYYIDGKRLGVEGFNIKVEKSNGKKLERRNEIDIRSGIYGIRKIEPKCKMKFFIHDLSKYGISRAKGLYNVIIDKELDVYFNNKSTIKNLDMEPKNFDRFLRIQKSISTEVKVFG